MIKELCGIHMENDVFNSKELNLFEKNRLALIYGRNGAGKSTITKEFLHLVNEKETDCYVYDKDNNKLNISESKKSIHIFDEKYIDEKVRLHDTGLGSIVMLGKSAEVDKEIEDKRKERDAKNRLIEKAKKDIEQYQKEDNKCPEYYENLIRSELKSTWVPRKTDIDGKNHKISIQIINKISNLDVKDEKQKLEKEFYNLLGYYRKAEDGVGIIDQKVHTLDIEEKIDSIIKLLNLGIERPQLNSRDLKLIDIMSTEDSEFAKSKKIINEELEVCPFCLQEISSVQREKVKRYISMALNREAECHRKELELALLKHVDIDLLKVSFLDNESTSKCMEIIPRINEEINRINDIILEKKRNVYEAKRINKGDFIILLNQVSEVNDILKSLEIKRQDYNEKIKHKAKMLNELNGLNDKIAKLEIKEYLKLKKKFNIEKEKKQNYLDSLNEGKTKIEKEIVKLEQEKSNITLAVKIINEKLRYIFMDDQRLFIRSTEKNEYQLFVRGNSVKPCNVSTGERNALALAYFFTEIAKGEEVENVYRKEHLIIIDDPITSMDYDNRIGLISLLNQQIKELIFKNENSKILLMTHDYRTYLDLGKIISELNMSETKERYRNECVSIGKSIGRKFRLANKELVNFPERNYNDYGSMLEDIYTFAKGGINEFDISIGNMMRRVLERYATFEYRKGIENICRYPVVLETLSEKNEKYRKYFENSMYRLVLHGESHAKESVDDIDSDQYEQFIPIEQKRRTAQDLICLLYLLNPNHLRTYVNGDGAESDIQEWCKNIERSA